MNGMSHRAVLLLGLAALTLVTPAPIRAWKLDQSALRRVPLPFTLSLAPEDSSGDFDQDGLPEPLTLTQGRATIWKENQRLWQSPRTWRVEQAHVTDLNRDGLPEVSLLVWRPFKPWPVDHWLPHGGRIEDFHDAAGMSCHIILIGWKQGAYHELWAGSAMAAPVKSFTAVDLAGNGLQYLVTLETEYDDPPSGPARTLKVWEWNGFGFTVVNELDGSFTQLNTVQTKNRQVFIVSP